MTNRCTPCSRLCDFLYKTYTGTCFLLFGEKAKTPSRENVELASGVASKVFTPGGRGIQTTLMTNAEGCFKHRLITPASTQGLQALRAKQTKKPDELTEEEALPFLECVKKNALPVITGRSCIPYITIVLSLNFLSELAPIIIGFLGVDLKNWGTTDFTKFEIPKIGQKAIQDQLLKFNNKTSAPPTNYKDWVQPHIASANDVLKRGPPLEKVPTVIATVIAPAGDFCFTQTSEVKGAERMFFIRDNSWNVVSVRHPASFTPRSYPNAFSIACSDAAIPNHWSFHPFVAQSLPQGLSDEMQVKRILMKTYYILILGKTPVVPATPPTEVSKKQASSSAQTPKTPRLATIHEKPVLRKEIMTVPSNGVFRISDESSELIVLNVLSVNPAVLEGKSKLSMQERLVEFAKANGQLLDKISAAAEERLFKIMHPELAKEAQRIAVSPPSSGIVAPHIKSEAGEARNKAR